MPNLPPNDQNLKSFIIVFVIGHQLHADDNDLQSTINFALLYIAVFIHHLCSLFNLVNHFISALYFMDSIIHKHHLAHSQSRIKAFFIQKQSRLSECISLRLESHLCLLVKSSFIAVHKQRRRLSKLVLCRKRNTCVGNRCYYFELVNKNII